MFVVIEGPNGVGKSTLCAELAGLIESAGFPVEATKEPSASALGQAIRDLEGELVGSALAQACAADRLHHVAHVIEPALDAGKWILCDRYVPSSLVLQRLDGVSMEEVWSLNCKVRKPDVVIYLIDEPAAIINRLELRGALSRLEQEGSPSVELAYYEDAAEFLEAEGWSQFSVDGAEKAPEAIAKEIVERLLPS